MADALAVDEEQMIAARPAGDVDVFPELDRAFGAENEQPAVAPGRQAVLREPVDADEAGRVVGLVRSISPKSSNSGVCG